MSLGIPANTFPAAAAAVLLFLIQSALTSEAAAGKLTTVVGVSLDWRSNGNGEQLLVTPSGEILTITDEHANFTLGSTIGFIVGPVPCLPASFHACFRKQSIVSAYIFRPARTRLAVRAVLIAEGQDTVTVQAQATPTGQPRLEFIFRATPRALAKGIVHAGGL